MRRLFVALILVALSCNEFIRYGLAQPLQTPVRINCGGNTFVDLAGNTWTADTDMGSFSDGTRTSFTKSDVTNTDKSMIYRSERYTTDRSAPMTYNIPLANGVYDVNLHFAEIYDGAFNVGSRIFDVFMEESLIFKDLDVFEAAGSEGNKAIVLTQTVEVKDGALTMGFGRIIQNPKINAIEVIAAASGTVVPPDDTGTSEPEQNKNSIFINCGSTGSYTDIRGTEWISDESFVNDGTRRYSTLAGIDNTDNPTLYKTERYKPNSGGNMTYTIPMENGMKLVNLHFSEIFSGAFNVGSRVFNVFVEGKLVSNQMDVYLAAGEAGNTAYILNTTVGVTDGALTLDFIGVKQNPKISGIEVHEATSPPELQPLFINAGTANNYTDPEGNVWISDSGFYNIGAKKYSTLSGISNTNKPKIYKTERYASELSYRIPLWNGLWDVKIHEAEIYSGAFSVGSRVFSVTVQGDVVEESFDIFEAAGQGRTAVIMEQKDVIVSDGILTIDLIGIKDNAKVSAIEVRPAASTLPSSATTSVATTSTTVRETTTTSTTLEETTTTTTLKPTTTTTTTTPQKTTTTTSTTPSTTYTTTTTTTTTTPIALLDLTYSRECNVGAPCGLCEGDCDRDSHCEPGLKCSSGYSFETIPSCGGLGDSGVEYCYNPTFPFSLTVTTECSINNLCRECQGRCDSDFDCLGDLVCFARKGDEPVPGCATGGLGDMMGTNYCHKPLTKGPVTYVPGALTRYQNGLELSTGLTSRIVATSGRRVYYDVGGSSSAIFHSLPDGAGVFPTPDGGWIYMSNSEDSSSRDSSRGGVGAIRFDSLGRVISYSMVSRDTALNCGGGKTWWNTWLTCEERSGGHVWEVDPLNANNNRKTLFGMDRDNGGYFESVAYYRPDPSNPTFYITEDKSSGALRRFTPDVEAVRIANQSNDYSQLLHSNPARTAKIEYLKLRPESSSRGTFTWTSDKSSAENDASNYYSYSEGIDIANGILYMTAKLPKILMILDLETGRYERRSTESGAFAGQPDQIRKITGNTTMEDIVYFCEDSSADGDNGVHGRDGLGNFYTILQGRNLGETTGLDFTPDKMKMYVSFQQAGRIYEITRQDGYPFGGTRLDIKYHSA